MNKDKNCGLCGEKSCADFRKNIKDGKKQITDCPFYKDNNTNNVNENENLDFHNNIYDFLLKPIGDEPSARKLIRPFRTDLIEKLKIKDITLIACIKRGGKISTPRGRDIIQKGDTVIVVTTHTGFKSINDILE
jgi:Trk K+ transport system NAD-binding subunit